MPLHPLDTDERLYNHAGGSRQDGVQLGTRIFCTDSFNKGSDRVN